jgi:hypothetical protein
VAVRIRRARGSVNGRVPEDDAHQDNRLDLMDQAFYAGHRAAGQKETMQMAWLYERAIDFDQLRRFHRNLTQGLLGRRIERSPLPFGRYRWVSDRQPSNLDIAENARPPAELADWLDEQSQVPVDPESGPGWRLSVGEFTDGSAAISLVISHYIVDGIGAVVAVALASLGETLDLGYPPPRSRSLLSGLRQDIGETARDVPAVGRAMIAAVKEARRRRQDDSRPLAPPPVAELPVETDHPVAVPAIWIRLNMAEWTARAEALGGTGSTLAAALTAKFDERMGRRHGDSDHVKLLLLVNDRTEGDARAVAVSFARVLIDPAEVTTDLSGTRAAVKHALKTLRDTPDESSHLVALTPFTPKRAWQQMIDYGLSDPDNWAVCSNLGDTGPVVIRPDGEPCDSAFARGIHQHMTQRWIERMGSQLHLYVGTAVEINTVGIHVRAYQPGAMTTKAALRELAVGILAEFGLNGAID